MSGRTPKKGRPGGATPRKPKGKSKPRPKSGSASKPKAKAGTAGAPQSHRVAKLRAGTVIDHLEAGTALRCLKVLGVPEESVVTIGINLPSRMMKRKDILKIENRELTSGEIARLALFGPRSTVAIIQDYAVVKKVPVELPTVLDGVLACPNPSCITHHDRLSPRVRVERPRPLRLRCHYCERLIRTNEIELL